MNVLLVEDEPSVAEIINKGLTENGYRVSVALDGHTGLQLALQHPFDVLILDMMLPGINGMELCRKIRELKIATPILFLTALGTTENIVAGLDAGGDDYLIKPFKFAELEARLRSLHRRRHLSGEKDDAFLIADLDINLTTKLIHKSGNLITLTPTEFRLLEYFVRNRNKVLSRIEILEHVWGIDFNMGTNVVDVYINYLRKKIDTNPSIKLIQTVVGMGYMLKT